MTIEPGGSLERALDEAVMRHPAGRRRSIGFLRVELAPGVYVIECLACGQLFRIGSPHIVAHHETHRRRPTLLARIRRASSRAEHYVRALFMRS